MSHHVPLRVAVVSRNYIVRAGLVALVADLDHSIVVPEHSEGIDLVLFDIDSTQGHPEDDEQVADYLLHSVPVLGIVYENGRAPASGSDIPLLTLSTTPMELAHMIERLSVIPGQPADEAQLLGLTTREIDVLRLIATGHPNAHIANTLHVSLNTVKSYVRTAYQKIGVQSRTQAVRWALRHGLVSPADAEVDGKGS
jgi:DNA-binding CsgD family transcriptional regulator